MIVIKHIFLVGIIFFLNVPEVFSNIGSQLISIKILIFFINVYIYYRNFFYSNAKYKFSVKYLSFNYKILFVSEIGISNPHWVRVSQISDLVIR